MNTFVLRCRLAALLLPPLLPPLPLPVCSNAPYNQLFSRLYFRYPMSEAGYVHTGPPSYRPYQQAIGTFSHVRCFWSKTFPVFAHYYPSWANARRKNQPAQTWMFFAEVFAPFRPFPTAGFLGRVYFFSFGHLAGFVSSSSEYRRAVNCASSCCRLSWNWR